MLNMHRYKYIENKKKRHILQIVLGTVTILRTDKIDFKIKSITGLKEGKFIMIKGLIFQEDIIIPNVTAPKTEHQNT